MKRLDYKWQDCQTWRGLARELAWGAIYATALVLLLKGALALSRAFL